MSTASRSLTTRTSPDFTATKPVSPDLIRGILYVVDFCIIGACGGIAYAVWLTNAPSLDWTAYMLLATLGALLAMNTFHVSGAYDWNHLCSLATSLQRSFAAWAVVFALLIVVAFVTKTSEQFSRAWFLIWFATAGVLVGTSRIILYRAIVDWKSRGCLCRDAVVFGVGPVGQRLIAATAAAINPEIRVCAAFDDRLSRSPDHCQGIPVMGDLDTLMEMVREEPIDLVLIAIPPTAEERLATILDRLKTVPVDVRLCAGDIGFRLGPVGVSHLCNVPLLNVVDRPLTGWRGTAKTVEDYVVASLILLLIAPLMLFIAAAIKLDSPGPVFFRQKRYGFNNQLIEVFKFRTMHHDQRDLNAEQLTRRNDPRITRLGAFLRRTSLDELPQFFNVLRGEMSVVGPRPHACRAKAAGVLYQDAVQRYAARHRVKPGITGWAQVNGWRGETETLEQIRQRVQHDLTYIENWSLGFDLKIILRTVLTGFTGQQAY